MNTLFLASPISTTKSKLIDVLQDILGYSENWLSRLESFWVYPLAFKDGNYANTFLKKLIEIAKICYSRVLLSYSVLLRIYH